MAFIAYTVAFNVIKTIRIFQAMALYCLNKLGRELVVRVARGRVWHWHPQENQGYVAIRDGMGPHRGAARPKR